MMTWLFGNKDHLYRCSLTGRYHDPLVLQRFLSQGVNDVPTIREAFGCQRPTQPDGSGYSEGQCLAEYDRFAAWLEGKGVTVQTSPTAAPSTD